MAENPNETPMNEADIQAINKSLIDDGLVTPDHYYIDLGLFKDFRLGYIFKQLSLLPEAEASVLYDKVMENIPRYQSRCFHGFTFPGTSFNIDEIDKALLAEDDVTEIFLRSPATVFFDTIDAHIFTNRNHSQLKERFTKRYTNKEKTHYVRDWASVTFHVNTYPLKLSELDRSLLAGILINRWGVDVEVLYHPPFEIPKALFTQCEEFHIYRPDWFIESPGVQEALEPLKNLKKTFFVKPLFDTSKKAEWPLPRLKREVDTFQGYLNMFVDFHWYSNRNLSFADTAFTDPLFEN